MKNEYEKWRRISTYYLKSELKEMEKNRWNKKKKIKKYLKKRKEFSEKERMRDNQLHQ